MRTALRVLFISTLVVVAVGLLVPPAWIPDAHRDLYHLAFGEGRWREAPETVPAPPLDAEPFCPEGDARAREAQEIEGVAVAASPLCHPDDPYAVAAFVRGTNRVSMATLHASGLAPDAVEKTDDVDGDGDPDHIRIRLEVVELNGPSPDGPELVPGYAIAPGIQPSFWVFAPKTMGMATRSLEDLRAHPLLRAPSPTIRVEQGDRVEIVLENTHSMPHTIHLHGVDHPWLDESGEGNDGVPQTSEPPVLPGANRSYEIAPRHAGTMFYHCHVQPHTHILMGLQGMFVVEPARPDNWVQTLNPGAGHVRHPSVAVRETFDREYDLHYQDVDRELHETVQSARDPRLRAVRMNQEYDITERTADYFLLNGRSFPYTFREGLVVVAPEEAVLLRVLNGGLSSVALHTHGHKVELLASDGVDHPEAARLMRDVVTIDSAQRVDLALRTENDGLHAYGEGIWLLHDHHENAVTTDGIHPGGDVSAIVYESLLGEDAWPRTRGMDWTRFFDARFYRSEIGIWDDMGGFGRPESRSPTIRLAALVALAGGLVGGLLGRIVRRGRGR